MSINRRSAVIAAAVGFAGSLLLKEGPAFASPVQIEGTKPPPKYAEDIAGEIINSLPSTDYVAIMDALANLEKLGPKGPDGLPYNERWPVHANPLLVRMWHDVHETYIVNDCESWCGVALGWCLQRSGHKLPDDCPSSQAYLKYGTPVATPMPGDIAVFTNYDDSGHGHVTIFRKWIDARTIEALGGNQQLSGPTNCPNGFGVSVIDQRAMATDTKLVAPDGKITGHHLNKFMRPPPPINPPAKNSGPVLF